MIRAQSPFIASEIAPSPTALIFGARYGGIADAVKGADGVWNAEEAHDNTEALDAFFDDMLAQGKDGYIPRGNWAYGYTQAGTGALIEKVFCSGLRLSGAGRSTKLVFLTRRDGNNNPVKRQGINFGGNANWTSPEASTVTLTAPSTTSSLILEVSSTADMFVGKYLFPSDRAQVVKYHQGTFDIDEPGSIMYCLSCYVQVQEIIDATHVRIGGTPEYGFTAGTKIGCLQAPNIGVTIENLCFVYCKENSPRGGAFSALNCIGNVDLTLSNLYSEDATSRCITIRRGLKYTFKNLTAINTDPDDGSFMTVSNMAQHGTVIGGRSESGTHFLDFGGGIMDPAAHWNVTDVEGIGVGGSVVGSHKSFHHGIFTRITVRGIDRAFDSNPEADPGDVGTGITMRGAYCQVIDSTTVRVPIGFRGHKSWGVQFINCEAERCGRGFFIDNVSEHGLINCRVREGLYLGFDITISAGPVQGYEMQANSLIDGFHIIGSSPATGTGRLSLSGPYELSNFFGDLGGMWLNIDDNGQPAEIIGLGNAADNMQYYIPAPTTERAGQLVGPAFPIVPSKGAISAAVNSIAGLTESYSGGQILAVPGGTLFSGGTTAYLVVTKLKLISVDIKYGGLLNAVGNVKTLGGGTFTVPAQWTVGSVNGGGTALTGSITTAGVYTVTAPELTQAGTTGPGVGVSVNTATVRNGGSGAAVGDRLIVQGGHPVTIAGVPQWPQITVTAPIGPNGLVLTGDVTFGGSLYELPDSGILSQNFTTGIGKKTTWDIQTSTDNSMTFTNPVWTPLEFAVHVPGSKYDTTPGNPVTLDGGVTVDIVWGTVADLGASPREDCELQGTGGPIESFGSRQNVERVLTAAGTWTIAENANISLPNNAGTLRFTAGMQLKLASNQGNPTKWLGSSPTKPDGTPLRLGVQVAATAKTQGATLTAAEIVTGIITANAADNLADNYQLPTGANLAGSNGFPGFIVNDFFDFTVINLNATGGATATITTNTDWTLVGSMVVAISSTGRFRAAKTGTTTWILYRIG